MPEVASGPEVGRTEMFLPTSDSSILPGSEFVRATWLKSDFHRLNSTESL